FLIDSVQLGLFYSTFRNPHSALANWTTRFPFLDLLPATIAEVAHAFRVRPGTISAAFEQGGATAGTSALHGLAGVPINRFDIIAVYLNSRYAVSFTTGGNIWVASRVFERHFSGVLVVFADEKNG